jgi:hypothetical protein
MSGLIDRISWRVRHKNLVARARSNEKDSDLFLLDEESTVPSSLSERVERRLRRKRIARWVTSLLAGLMLAGAGAIAALEVFCLRGC